MFTIEKKFVPMAFLAMTMAVSACGGSDDSPGENDCGGCPDGLLCDTSTGVCVGCRNSFDCEAPKAICRTSDHVCVECLNKSDCLEGMTCNLGVCEREQEEAECSLTKPCVGEGETCDYEHGVCFSQIECTPENAATVCPGSECTSAGNCLNSKTVYCDDSKIPENSDAILEMVNIAWTATAGWTNAAKCDWNCSNGYEENSSKTGCVKTPDCTPDNQAATCPGSICVNGSCQTSKKVDCKSVDHGAHSTNIVTQVTITWSSSTGTWTEPAVCEWKCDTGSSGNWVKDGEVCVKAPDCTPDNQATTCPNGGQCGDSGSCITSKSVPCDSTGTPAHATAHQENVTITWTAATGWTSAAACAWDCNLNENYVLNETRDGCKLNETPTCTPGTCTSNKYCQIDGTEWDCRQEYCEANTSDPAKGGCFECTQASHCGNENDYYCNSNHFCSQYICNSHHSCTGAHQTCDTSAVGGACVMASCTGTVCTDDGYICVDGKYTPCRHGCNSDGTCKSALTGCAAEANPDGWCRSNSEDGDVCDTSSGKCVECMIDSNSAHNTCTSVQTCTNNHCVNNCGNGKLESDEYCDNSIPMSQWRYTTCDAYIYQGSPVYLHFVGELTCSSDCMLDNTGCTLCGNNNLDEGEDCDPTVASSQWSSSSCSQIDPDWSGDLSCTNECKLSADGCTAGPCDAYTADEECTMYMGGPQPCDVYAPFHGEEGVSTTAKIVCKPASATCPTKMVIDADETLEVCFPTVNKVAVGWCRTQSHSGGFGVTLNSSSSSTDFWGQVYVADVTGTDHAGSSDVRGELVYWDENYENMKSVPGVKNSGGGFEASNANDQWSATVSLSDFSASGSYYYAWRFTADNGASWYYCLNEPSGGAKSDYVDVLLDDSSANNIITVTKSAKSYTQDFESFETTSDQYATTETKTDSDGITWTYVGRTSLTNSGTDYSISGRGVILRGGEGPKISASGMNGVSKVSFDYKWWNNKTNVKIQTKAKESDSTYLESVTTNITSNANGGNAEITLSKSGTAKYVEIVPASTSTSSRIIVDNVIVYE